jgi:hypothetical protein
MKHFVLAAIFFGSLIVVSGCKGKSPLNPLGCVNNAEKVGEAAVRFSQDPTKSNCEAYKKEVVAFIKSCPTYYGAVEKAELEEFANSPCEE